MLGELNKMQPDDRTIMDTTLSIEITTQSDDSERLLKESYTFGFVPEHDKWIIEEYVEQRSQDTDQVRDRQWSQTDHILWYDDDFEDRLTVPTTVADRLAEAVGVDSVTIQVPSTDSYKIVYDSAND